MPKCNKKKLRVGIDAGPLVRPLKKKTGTLFLWKRFLVSVYNFLFLTDGGYFLEKTGAKSVPAKFHSLVFFKFPFFFLFSFLLFTILFSPPPPLLPPPSCLLLSKQTNKRLGSGPGVLSFSFAIPKELLCIFGSSNNNFHFITPIQIRMTFFK